MIVSPIMREYPKCNDGMAAWQIISILRSTKQELYHHTVLITKLVLCPDASCSIGSMHGIDKAIAASQFSIGALHTLVTQQSRRHTRPQGKHHKGEEIADSQCASPCLVEVRTCG